MKAGSPYTFSVAYTLVTALVITGAETGMEWLYYASKPLLMILLLLVFRKGVGKGEGKLITGALVFSLTGDVMLMFDGRNALFFISGLLMFMIAHLCYTVFFTVDIIRSRPWNQHWFQMAVATVMVVYAAEFYILNRSYFDGLWLPVLIYICVIAGMGISAAMRDRTRPETAYKPILAGAILFITSDSILAVNKFVMELPFSKGIVLALYAAAQFFLVKGILRIYSYRKENSALSTAAI